MFMRISFWEIINNPISKIRAKHVAPNWSCIDFRIDDDLIIIRVN